MIFPGSRQGARSAYITCGGFSPEAVLRTVSMKEHSLFGETGMRPQTQKLALCALLCALAVVLSGLEALIPPLPMLPPGAKLGLSNIVTMFAAGSVGILPALFIALFKALFAGLTRGLVAGAMSLAGGLCSTMAMALLFRRAAKQVGLIGVGVAGALTHNLAQLGVAFLLAGGAVAFYLPWLLLFALLTGTLTGLLLRSILPLLERIPFI